MKCAIYTRVSTDDQGQSLDNQKAFFMDYIRRNHLEVYRIYEDNAFSGTEITKRLSFLQLLEDGKAGRYHVLLAKSYSRFGRNQRETLAALAMLFERGVRIIFVEDGLDSQRDKGQFGLFAWLAEQEARKISERIKLTWQVYNKAGKIHTTNAPHGYTYDHLQKNFIINEKEAPVVQAIFHWYTQGDGMRKIAARLNESGHVTKNGCAFSPFLVRNILRNPFYTGTLVQGKRRTIDVTIKKTHAVAESDWFVHPGHHEALITQSQFDQVQALMSSRRSRPTQMESVGRHSNTHLFSNLLFCKLCGHPMTMKRPGCYSCAAYEQGGAKSSGHRRNAVPEDLLLACIRQVLKKADKAKLLAALENKKSPTQPEKKMRDMEKAKAEKVKLSLALLESFTKGMVGETQFALQNQAIEEDLAQLNRGIQLLLQAKETTTLPCSVTDVLDMRPGHWNNAMMKHLVQAVHVDMTTLEITMVFNFDI